MNKLYKPNGKEVIVNDNSLEYALSLGWNDKKPVKKAAKKPVKKAPAKKTTVASGRTIPRKPAKKKKSLG